MKCYVLVDELGLEFEFFFGELLFLLLLLLMFMFIFSIFFWGIVSLILGVLWVLFLFFLLIGLFKGFVLIIWKLFRGDDLGFFEIFEFFLNSGLFSVMFFCFVNFCGGLGLFDILLDVNLSEMLMFGELKVGLFSVMFFFWIKLGFGILIIFLFELFDWFGELDVELLKEIVLWFNVIFCVEFLWWMLFNFLRIFFF